MLTPKRRDLWIVLTAMRLCGEKWIFGEANVPAKFRERTTGREVAGLIAVDVDGVPVDASTLEWAPGPGWPKSVGVEDLAPWASPPLSRRTRRRKKD